MTQQKKYTSRHSLSHPVGKQVSLERLYPAAVDLVDECGEVGFIGANRGAVEHEEAAWVEGRGVLVGDEDANRVGFLNMGSQRSVVSVTSDLRVSLSMSLSPKLISENMIRRMSGR